MTDGWNRRDVGFVLVALAWLALTSGIRPLALPDEGRYAAVAWEMVTSGDWLCPTLDGLPFFHKPPLFYWITASGLAVFGPHDWAARLAPWLGASVATVCLYGFSLRQRGRTFARWAVTILVTLPFFFGGAQFANLDMLVAGFIAATILLAAEAVLRAESAKPSRSFLLGASACAALGVLAKGLIGVVLPGLVLVAWLTWNRRPRLLLRLLWLPGPLVFTALAVPWFVAIQSRYPGFFDYFFLDQQFHRYTGSGFNNPQPVWFYLPVVLVASLPWSWWLPAAWKASRADASPRPTVASLMWVWLIAIVAFFSIPSSKLIGYVLPVLPPLAFLVASGLEAKGDGSWRRPPRRVAFCAGLVCVVLVLAARLSDHSSRKALSERIAAQRLGSEAVAFLDYQFLDLPFYLRLREPVRMFNDWSDADSWQGDGWRQTIVDAAEFAPETAGRLLLEPSRFAAFVCSQPVTWAIGKQGIEDRYPLLERGQVRAQQGKTRAWRLDAAQLNLEGACPPLPNSTTPTKGTPP